MTKGVSFVDSFWDTDIQGSHGWDTICRRMRDGKKVCTEASHYFKARGKAEQEYSKALLNLTRKADGKEETGILGLGWRDLKAQTEEIAKAHAEAGDHFSNLAEELVRFNDDQTKVKQNVEDTVKRSINNKKSEYEKTMQNKKNYEQKCRECDTAEESYNTMHQAVTYTKKEIEKAKNKVEKCKSSRENADLAYKSSIENLEAARKNWELQMEEAFKELESLEVSRMATTRDKIWKCTNIDSLTCVRHDDCCEKIREKLENCDILVDLQEYIQNNKTGSIRPAPVEYENYYKGSGIVKAGNHRAAMKLPPQLPPHNTSPYVTARIDEGAYASVDGPSELDVAEGDIVELINQTRDNFITVKTQNHRRVGVIPAQCAVTWKIQESTFL